jgi:hypothetical protein
MCDCMTIVTCRWMLLVVCINIIENDCDDFCEMYVVHDGLEQFYLIIFDLMTGIF